MRYRKPEELKETDVEWSGDIPVDWDTTKLKFQTMVNMGQSPPSDGYNKKGIGTAFLQGNADFTDKYPQTESFTDNGNAFRG
ncbi:hypothetical protein ACG2F4_14115 [Halalkalibaculum sp. DA3122]|uniref:hypothetical protein n=1 Tax=Halalkalibaculum sp. DA3122 TaxID=3373607 RepID=UPI003754788E